ncbi:MAG: hypothetical protein ORN23_07820 [Chthoniobacterales bacterium]|nr:hypothetical protein [Chthoniobacterales bacterium]
MRRLIDFWALVSVLVVFGGGLIALLRRLDRGRRSLLRKKIALLTELHDLLEKNPAMGRAVTFLKESDLEKRLEHLLAPGGVSLTEAEVVIKEDLDALFQVLNRIAHAVTITKILTREETEIFSGYFRLLQHHPILSQYFYKSGFLDLWDFAQSWMEKLSGDEIEI